MIWFKPIVKKGNSHYIMLPAELMEFLRLKKGDKLGLEIAKSKNGDYLKILTYKD